MITSVCAKQHAQFALSCMEITVESSSIIVVDNPIGKILVFSRSLSKNGIYTPKYMRKH